MPFHILGFDLMIDQKLKAWVLEINHSPSLNIYFQKDKEEMSIPVPGAKKEGPVLDPVDVYVKSRVVQDSINLAWEMSKGALPEGDFKSLSKILPNS